MASHMQMDILGRSQKYWIKENLEMNFKMSRLMVAGTVTTMLGATLAQAAFANHDKVTTITTRNYTPMAVTTPVIIEQQPAMTTTTVQRTTETPVVIERPSMVVERQTVLSSPVVQERRVEVLNTNIAPTTSSTTVTRTTTLEP
jgi:hypothetical protein